MGASLDIFNAMASDIGVVRSETEESNSFCRRVAYSAARFWTMAFCMDDGDDGISGIAKQSINRCFQKWVHSLDSLCPGLEEWFYSDEEKAGLRAIYGRMLDIGDLQIKDFDGSISASAPGVLKVSSKHGLLTGFHNPACLSPSYDGVQFANPITSGLATVVECQGKMVRADHWWERDLPFLPWEDSKKFDSILFIDPKSRRWNIRRLDARCENPVWIDGISLAVAPGEDNYTDQFFVARKSHSRTLISEINLRKACNLFFYLREAADNKAITEYEPFDDKHVKVVLPIGYVPGYLNRVLDDVTWPINSANDRFKRIARIEALPMIEELLSASSVGIKGR